MQQLIATLLVVLAGARHCIATRGSRVTVHNQTPHVLRLVAVYDKDTDWSFSADRILFFPPNASHVYQGYNQGYGELDVTFLLQRYCPGTSKDGTPFSRLNDNYVDVADFRVRLICKQRMYVPTNQVTQFHNPGIFAPWSRVFMDCNYYPATGGSGHKCRMDKTFTFGNEGDTADFSQDDTNSIKASAVRHGDSSDWKEFEVTLQMPPKACLHQDHPCAIDWRAPYCNAQ